ncbi:MAG TPA: response regulator [Spirochaetota bacterium]|nr:response regulator [Spirochaetota bacterium]HPR46566.1 response regulator [Spirochaetota bacterium]
MINNHINMKKQANILIVDDTPANLTLLSGILKEKGYRVRPVPSGKLALGAVEIEPPDLILLDISMPELDGFEVCRRLKDDIRFRDIPVIFVSALTETLEKVKAFSVGGVDYITKPFQFEEIEARVETHLKLHRYQTYLEELVQEQVREISESQMSTIFALSKLAESRDRETGRHLERVQRYCALLAENLKNEPPYISVIDDTFISNLINASPLHDIGKVAIEDRILLKPGKLTDDEFEIMKTHSAIGAATIEAVHEQYPKNSFINMGISMARSHHEWWNGNGYPQSLEGDEIPLPARIMAVADVYDALRSTRCYKGPYSRSESRDIIEKGSGTQFEPLMVNVFLSKEDDFNRISREMGCC